MPTRPTVSTAQATPSSAHDGFKTSEYVGYALGDTTSNFFFQTFNIFLTYYYVDVWGIPAAALLWLIRLVRAFGAFDDVLMGLVADRTNTRWGKFRPYLLFGAIPFFGRPAPAPVPFQNEFCPLCLPGMDTSIPCGHASRRT